MKHHRFGPRRAIALLVLATAGLGASVAPAMAAEPAPQPSSFCKRTSPLACVPVGSELYPGVTIAGAVLAFIPGARLNSRAVLNSSGTAFMVFGKNGRRSFMATVSRTTGEVRVT